MVHEIHHFRPDHYNITLFFKKRKKIKKMTLEIEGSIFWGNLHPHPNCIRT